MHPDDNLLVKRSKDGKLDAFEELVKRYEGNVYTVAYRLMGNHADASDLAQDAFIRAYQSLQSFREDAGFATWLYRITSNICLDEIRKHNRHKKLSLDEMILNPGGNPILAVTELSPEENLEKTEVKDLVQRYLNTLSREHRLILILREIQGLSYKEIAFCLDCSINTVKTRLLRARQALKVRIFETREPLESQ